MSEQPPPLPGSTPPPGPPPLPTPPPLPAQAPPAIPVEPVPHVAPGPAPLPKSYVRTRRSKVKPYLYVLGAGLAIVAGTFVANEVFGLGGNTGLKSVRYVSSETDYAGRIVSTTFAVDYEVAVSGKDTESCDFEFFDRDGKKLQVKGAPSTRFSGGGTEQVRVRQDDGTYRTETRNKTAQFREQAQLTVEGVPDKVKMHCF